MMQDQRAVVNKPKSPLRRFCEKIFTNGAKSDIEKIQGAPPITPTGSSSDCASPWERRSGELRKVFQFFDEDGDGRISPSELRSCMNMMGEDWLEQEAASALRSIDMDGDGWVGFEDFLRLMDGENGSGGDREEEREDIRAAFGMYAMKGEQCITPKSLKRMLQRLGERKTTDECRKMIGRFDINGDGVLSFDEFEHMMMMVR